MRKIVAWVLVVVLVLMAVSAVLAGDILTRDACEAAGGVFTNDRGTKTCEISTTTEQQVTVAQDRLQSIEPSPDH